METFCCVNGCKSNTYSAEKNPTTLTFHAFPSNPEHSQQWQQALGRPGWDPPVHVRICSAHSSLSINQSINPDGLTVEIKEEALSMNSLQSNSSFVEASDVEVCRICLATDMKMSSLRQGKLKTCMEIISRFNDNRQNADNLPQYVCFECETQLLKYYRLVEKSRIAQATLLDIIAEKCEITKDLVRQRDRKQLNLQSTLGISKPVTDFVYTYKYEGDDDSDISDDVYLDDLAKRKKVTKSDDPNTILRRKDDDRKIQLRKRKTEVTNKKTKNSIEKKKRNKIMATSIVIESVNVSENFKDEESNSVLKSEPPFDAEHSYVETMYVDCEDSPKETKQAPPNLTFNVEVEKNELFSDDEKSDNKDIQHPVSKNKTKKDKPCVRSRNNVNKKKVKAKHQEETSTGTKQGKKEEINIEKLRTCFDILDLTLQEQINEWKKEIEQEAGPNWAFKCEVCSRKFLRNKTYEQHVSRHKKIRGEYVCRVCDERFRYAARLDAHTIRVHCKRYECKKCPKVFYNMDSARRHHAHHSVEIHECGQCPFTTRTRSKIWLHRRLEHARDHHCARCGHSFINPKGLATHVSIAHTDKEDEPKGEFRCEECDITFNSEGARRVHMLTYKQHKNKNYENTPLDASLTAICLLCAATFPTKAELYAHKNKVHPEIKYKERNKRNRGPTYPRTCDHCDEEVKSRREHFWHVRRVHRSVKYHPDTFVVCEQCGKGFPTIGLFRYHMASHGGAPSFSCSACPKKFFSRPALKRHEIVHTPHKRYSCTDCGKAFKDRSNLHRHRRMHTGETPFECSHCAKKFKYYQSLHLHVKHVHYQTPWPARVRAAKAQKKTKHEAMEEREDFENE